MAGLNIIFAVLTWIAMFLIIPSKKIKRLLPVGFLAAGLLFAAQYTAITLNLIRYTKAIFYMAGMPLFQFLYAFAYGILLIHFMKKEWVRKIPVLIIFTLINEVITFILNIAGILEFLNRYNFWVDTVLTFAAFSIGVWMAEGLWKDRIYQDESYAR